MLKFAIKLTVAALVLWYVFNNLHMPDLWHNVTNANPAFLLLAFICLVLATLISAIRLGVYLGLPRVESIPLYYSGMLFNTLLPGGISGDGYIIYQLKKRHEREYKKSFQTLLLNRANGLFYLNLLFYAFLLASDYMYLPYALLVVIGLFVLQIPVYFVLSRKFLGETWGMFFKVAPYSLALQIFSVLSAIFVFMAMDVEGNVIEYTSQFIAASIASIIPITPGGVGLREFVFYKGSEIIGLDAEFAVAASLVYFALYILLSLTGIIFLWRSKHGSNINAGS